VGCQSEYQAREPIATLVALNVVIGILCSNSAIYTHHEVALSLYGYGWMILSGLNLAWLLYFTSSDESRLLSLLNPGFKRKQLIRSSINLRRSVSYSNSNLPNVTSELPGHYSGSHQITLGANQVTESRSSWHNEKQANDVTSALLPSNQPYLREGYYGDYDPQRMLPNNPQETPIANNTGTAPQIQLGSQFNNSGLQLQDVNSYSQPHQPSDNQADQQQLIDSNAHRPEPPSNMPRVNFSVASEPRDSASYLPAPSVNFAGMPLIDRTILNQAYRQEELRSVTLTDSATPTSPGSSQPAESTKKAKALYTYRASPTDPNEMGFDKGEVLDILNDSGKWWRARRTTGQSGIVPSNYLQMLPNP